MMATKKRAGHALPPALRCAVSPDATHVAHSNRTRLQIVRRSSGKVVHEAPVKDATCLSFRDDEDRLLALTTRGELSMHSIRSRSVVWREVVCDSEPFGGMILGAANELLVGYGKQVAVVDVASGRVSKRHPLPGMAHGFALGAKGRVVVCFSPEGGNGASFAVLGKEGVEPLFDLPGRYLGLLATSPSGRFVYGFSGLDHTVVDLSTKQTFAIHKGLGNGAVFLDDGLLLEGRKDDLAIDLAPGWQRSGSLDFKAKHLAASKDGDVIAAVGSAKGFVWTREELHIFTRTAAVPTPMSTKTTT
jgi:hypothetical protein